MIRSFSSGLSEISPQDKGRIIYVFSVIVSEIHLIGNGKSNFIQLLQKTCFPPGRNNNLLELGI
jgi:hypothetical protein